MRSPSHYDQMRRLTAMEDASNADRRWFLAHPERRYRLRRAEPCEVPPHEGLFPCVAVRRVGLCGGVKAIYWAGTPLPELPLEWPEDAAAAFFEQAEKGTGPDAAFCDRVERAAMRSFAEMLGEVAP